MSLMRSLRSKSGFSLVEALVASAIVVTALVGMGGVVTMVGGVNKKSRMENRVYDLEQHFLSLAMGVDSYSTTPAWQAALAAGIVPPDLYFKYVNVNSTASTLPTAVSIPISAGTMVSSTLVTSPSSGVAVTYFDQDLNVAPGCTALGGTACNYMLQAQMVSRTDTGSLVSAAGAVIFGIAYQISTSEASGSSAAISNFIDNTGDPFANPKNYNLFAPGGVTGTGTTNCNTVPGQFIMNGIDSVDLVPMCIGVLNVATQNTFPAVGGSTYDNSFPNGLTYSSTHGLQYSRTAPVAQFHCATAGTALASFQPQTAVLGGPGFVAGKCRVLVADNATYTTGPGGPPVAFGPADSLSGVACPVGYDSNSSAADCVISQDATKSRTGVCAGGGTVSAQKSTTCVVNNVGRTISVYAIPNPANTCGAYSWDLVTLNKLTCVSHTPGAPDVPAN